MPEAVRVHASLRSDDPLLALAAEQDDVASRRQLAALGVTRHRIRTEVCGRRWRLVGRVVVFHRGPLTTRQRWWVAVLHSGPAGALAGLSAAEAGGLCGWERDEVHVLVPKGAHVPPLPGLRLHESRRFRPIDVHPVRHPPQTRLPRSVIDAAVWLDQPMVAGGLVAAAVQQRLVTVPALRQALEVAGVVRHGRILWLLLADIEGGSHSLAEIDFFRLARLAGLSPPRRQVIRCDRSGRRRYLDAEFDGFTVEVDGGLHLRPIVAWDDHDRQNELTIAGDRMLRFSSVTVRLRQAHVIDQLRRADAAFGRRRA